MAYHLAYTVRNTSSTLDHYQHTFQSEAARNQFVQRLFSRQKLLVIKSIKLWPKPKYIPKQPTLWWDANKRPFADKYELLHEQQ